MVSWKRARMGHCGCRSQPATMACATSWTMAMLVENHLWRIPGGCRHCWAAGQLCLKAHNIQNLKKMCCKERGKGHQHCQPVFAFPPSKASSLWKHLLGRMKTWKFCMIQTICPPFVLSCLKKVLNALSLKEEPTPQRRIDRTLRSELLDEVCMCEKICNLWAEELETVYV